MNQYRVDLHEPTNGTIRVHILTAGEQQPYMLQADVRGLLTAIRRGWHPATNADVPTSFVRPGQAITDRVSP